MIEAQADVALGEAIRPAAIAHHRVYSGGLRIIWLPALALAGALVVSSLAGIVLELISTRLEALSPLLWLAGGVLGLMAAIRILSRQHLERFLASLRAMGSPPVFPTRFRFAEDEIAIDNPRLSHRATWDSVLFVIPAPEHWLIQIDTTTLAVPRRAFAGEAEEAAFLALAERALSEEARARSVLARQ